MENKSQFLAKLEWVFKGIIMIFHTISSLLIILITGWIITDVLGRVLFNHPIIGTPEVAANSLAAIAFLQIPYVMMSKGHVRSGMLVERMGVMGSQILEIFAGVLGFALFAVATVANWSPTLHSWAIGEYEGEGALRVPSYPVKTIILIGCAILTIQFLISIVQSTRTIINSRRGGV